jgi:hypothetical protein
MAWLFLGFILQIAACALVGARLLALAHRTRKLPELAFGAGFLLLGVLGQPVAVLARSPLAGSPELAGALLAAGLAAQKSGSAIRSSQIASCSGASPRSGSWRRSSRSSPRSSPA